MDDRAEGALLIIQDLSIHSAPAIDVVQQIMELDSPYAISETLLVMSNDTTLMAVDLTTPEIIILSMAIDSPEQIIIVNAPSGPSIIMLKDGVISGVDIEGEQLFMPTPEIQNIIMIRTAGSEIAYVTSDNPTTVYLARIETLGAIQIEIDAQAAHEQDLMLESWGTPLNMSNAKITNFVLHYDYVFATVNVTATERFVLFYRDRETQWLRSYDQKAIKKPNTGPGP